MRLKRTLTIGAAAGALAAWLAAAATTSVSVSRPPLTTARPPIDSRAADLASEIERLHERLRPGTAPHEPARNLFAFGGARRDAAAAPEHAPAIAEPVLPVTAAPPPVRLAGIAEDAGDNGAVARTAVLSLAGQVLLVKEGESVAGRYRVEKISADAVELGDVSGGPSLRLVLK